MLTPKTLTLDEIQNSRDIQCWLDQFSNDKRPTAINLLTRLKFISSDLYSSWLRQKILELADEKIGIYVCRKMNGQPFWDKGAPRHRPAKSLGSEDLVSSIVANIIKSGNKNITDHPSIDELRSQKIHKLLILDDSIGSGFRVSEFLEAFLANRSIMSWLSYGKIKFFIVAYAQMLESKQIILESIPGSNHGLRKFPQKSKIEFITSTTYSQKDMSYRWGNAAQNIISLCDSHAELSSYISRGFGSCMANIIFSHSIPDNIPGCLWSTDGKNIPLFPNRSFPPSTLDLFNGKPSHLHYKFKKDIDDTIIALLQEIKKGIRKPSSIALRLGTESLLVKKYLDISQQSGFISETNRLTKIGLDILKSHKNPQIEPNWNIYVPQTWCADHQPFSR